MVMPLAVVPRRPASWPAMSGMSVFVHAFMVVSPVSMATSWAPLPSPISSSPSGPKPRAWIDLTCGSPVAAFLRCLLWPYAGAAQASSPTARPARATDSFLRAMVFLLRRATDTPDTRLTLPDGRRVVQQKAGGALSRVRAPILVGAASRAAPEARVPLGSRHLPESIRAPLEPRRIETPHSGGGPGFECGVQRLDADPLRAGLPGIQDLGGVVEIPGGDA